MQSIPYSSRLKGFFQFEPPERTAPARRGTSMGRVMYLGGIPSLPPQPVDLLIGNSSVSLLNCTAEPGEGLHDCLAEIPLTRIRGVDKGAPTAAPVTEDTDCVTTETHVYLCCTSESGTPYRVELSLGALDDTGPVIRLCDRLRSAVVAVA